MSYKYTNLCLLLLHSQRVVCHVAVVLVADLVVVMVKTVGETVVI